MGGHSPVRVDVRVIATTNCDLRREIQEGRFREDLYYRLGVVQIRVPPLRERLEDLPALVQHFVTRAAQESGREITGVSAEAMERLRAHAWPGNVRELAHAIERAVIMTRTTVIGPDAFDLPGTTHVMAEARPARTRHTGIEDAVVLSTLNIAEAERRLIETALETAKQNRTRAATLLGISVRTLRNKLNRPDGLEDEVVGEA